MKTLLTIGYRGRSLAWLLRQLRQHGADALVDVREKPWSPEPDFRAPALAEAMQSEGLAYVGLSIAGNPYRPPLYRDIDECMRLYAERLEIKGIPIKALMAINRFDRPCLLCACRKAEECHRGVLAEAILRKAQHEHSAFDIVHLPHDPQGSLFGGGE